MNPGSGTTPTDDTDDLSYEEIVDSTGDLTMAVSNQWSDVRVSTLDIEDADMQISVVAASTDLASFDVGYDVGGIQVMLFPATEWLAFDDLWAMLLDNGADCVAIANPESVEYGDLAGQEQVFTGCGGSDAFVTITELEHTRTGRLMAINSQAVAGADVIAERMALVGLGLVSGPKACDDWPVFDWFAEAHVLVIVATGIVLNIGVTASSLILWRTIVGSWGSRPLNRRDVGLTLSTVIANSLVVVPGWWLWREGHLELASPSFFGWAVQTVYLLAVIDVGMYVAHRLCHWGPLFDWFHRWHHEDDAQMATSLFVMHPLEAASFGVVVIGAMVIWPVTLTAVSLFFTANLLVGTYAHLPDGVLDAVSRRVPPLVWVQGFHQRHHTEPGSNFGFFSPVWDRLGKTESVGAPSA